MSGKLVSEKFKYFSLVRAVHPMPSLTGTCRWSAVAEGAVAKVMDQGTSDMIYMRKCRRHYGISASQLFSSFKHANEEYYEDQFDGEKKAKQQMEWLIKKGDALLSNQTKHASIIICRKFGLRDLRKFRTTVFACELDDAPKRLDLGGKYTALGLLSSTDFIDTRRNTRSGSLELRSHSCRRKPFPTLRSRTRRQAAIPLRVPHT